MGYDMRTQIKPEGEERAVEKASAAFWRAVKARDVHPRGSAAADVAQIEVERTSRIMYDTERSYYRLNITGMSMWYRAIFTLGMVYDHAEDHSWPDYSDLSETAQAVIEALDEDDPIGYLAKNYPEVSAVEGDTDWTQALAYHDRLIALLKHHPEGGSTIPAHKFGSNDGWWVTPAECLEALAAWHARSDGERDDALSAAGIDIDDTDYARMWKRWLEFLELAVHCDGFRVR